MERIDALCKKAPVGKLLPDALYVHVSAIDKLDFKLQVTLCAAWSHAYTNENPTVFKISRKQPVVSFLYYDGFDTIEHPPLLKSIVVNYKDLKTKATDFLPPNRDVRQRPAPDKSIKVGRIVRK